jgi:hypothetical protein
LLVSFSTSEYARQSLAFSYDEGKASAKPKNANPGLPDMPIKV